MSYHFGALSNILTVPLLQCHSSRSGNILANTHNLSSTSAAPATHFRGASITLDCSAPLHLFTAFTCVCPPFLQRGEAQKVKTRITPPPQKKILPRGFQEYHKNLDTLAAFRARRECAEFHVPIVFSPLSGRRKTCKLNPGSHVPSHIFTLFSLPLLRNNYRLHGLLCFSRRWRCGDSKCSCQSLCRRTMLLRCRTFVCFFAYRVARRT